jgi:GTP cyclohydrolase II
MYEAELSIGLKAPVRVITNFGSSGTERADMAVLYGELANIPIVRVHSKCEFSALLGSDECDCGWQLHRSKEILVAHSGILIHLDQEGRGAGLAAKVQAFDLMHREGMDSYEAYERLGIPPDLREYDSAVELIRHLKLSAIRLLTNNPDKVRAFESAGIEVSRVPLAPTPTPMTAAYLAAKRRHGHLL